jgi:hypothetical protein
MVEIKGFKTSHSMGVKTALVGPIITGSEGHVECPRSEPANDDYTAWLNAAVRSGELLRIWGSTANGGPVFAAVETSHFDHRRFIKKQVIGVDGPRTAKGLLHATQGLPSHFA